MREQSFVNRFIIPLACVIGINLIAGYLYDSAAYMDHGLLRSVLISFSTTI